MPAFKMFILKKSNGLCNIAWQLPDGSMRKRRCINMQQAQICLDEIRAGEGRRP